MKKTSGNDVKAVRKLLAITQREMGQALGLAPCSVAAIEAGRIRLSQARNEKLLSALANGLGETALCRWDGLANERLSEAKAALDRAEAVRRLFETRRALGVWDRYFL